MHLYPTGVARWQWVHGKVIRHHFAACLAAVSLVQASSNKHVLHVQESQAEETSPSAKLRTSSPLRFKQDGDSLPSSDDGAGSWHIAAGGRGVQMDSASKSAHLVCGPQEPCETICSRHSSQCLDYEWCMCICVTDFHDTYPAESHTGFHAHTMLPSVVQL